MADTTKKQRIFMTGASGYVGSVITEFAVAEGYEVYGLSRSETSDEKLRKLGAVPVRGDLSSLDVLRREAAAADVVIHLADPFTYDLSKGYDPVIKAQAAVADAFADSLKGTDKVLLTTGGALMAASDPNGGETDETTPAPEEEIIPRGQVEKYDLSLAERGVRVATIRLAPFVYGRGGSAIRMLMKLGAQNGYVLCVDEGKAHTMTVHVDDAARLYLLAAKKARAGEKYIATAPGGVTQRQIADAIAAAVDVPVKSITPEEAIAKLGPFFGRFLAADNRSTSAKARREFGWEIRETTGILEDIRSGSYRAVAQAIKSGTGDSTLWGGH
ncbi:putative NAD dependent epimerase/dehydratase [Hypoxylon cercidicola]|nr:putative NAD dependent epimerase/dehydratase [Hypoxylon cercidicola]